MRSLLNTVIADLRGRVQSFLDIALLENVALAVRVAGPDARETIRLELEPYGQLVCFALASRAALKRLRLLHDAEKILYVVPDFVRDYVGLGKISGRLKTFAQFAVKRQVDVKLLICAAVERPGRGLRVAACGLHRIRKKHVRPAAAKICSQVRSVLPSTLATNCRISSCCPVG